MPGRGGVSSLERDSDLLLSRVPDPDERDAIGLRVHRATGKVRSLSRNLPGADHADIPTVVHAAFTRVSLGLRVLPLFGAMSVVGSLVGLLRRERIRDEFLFAGVTASYCAKFLAATSLVLYLFTSISPVGPPLWTLYLLTVTASAGAAVYFGNLPPKI